ncbi:hypothetical protein [Albimonas pacifica]|nr:hypothetical protein [Albimonas pacifica]
MALAAEFDEALVRTDRRPLLEGFCEIMASERAGLYRQASIEPERVGAFLILSAENAMTGASRVAEIEDWIVAGPILPTETRRYVLVADPGRPTAECAVKDLGERH